MNNKPIINKQEEIDYFKSIVKGHTTNEIIELYNKKYNFKLNKNQVKHLKRKYNLVSGINTKFKKGQQAHNHKPIGYEFLRDDGYIEIKIAEPNSWKLKQQYIWEKYNGKIPKGYRVVFLDQDKTNFDLDNLTLIQSKDILTTKNMKLFSKEKEITKVGILTAQLINKNANIRKEL